ncbi:MAG TPA: ribosome silencing factor [Acidimicrobiia bacterium]|nr:ribosome silencing factor [Acidimicrobiia bacterium]
MTVSDPVTYRRAVAAAQAAVDKKGTDVALLEVGEIITIIDWFVLVSASNTRQVRTIVDEVERALLDLDGAVPSGSEGRDDATWVLLDYGDVVIHVFLDQTRAYYDLDRLWADAPRVDWDETATIAAGGPR